MPAIKTLEGKIIQSCLSAKKRKMKIQDRQPVLEGKRRGRLERTPAPKERFAEHLLPVNRRKQRGREESLFSGVGRRT